MRGVDGNETCPVCYRVMVELTRFDPRADMFGLDPGDPPGYGRYHDDVGLLGEGLQRVLEWFGAQCSGWRLRRVARRWPRSMYCPGCGYLLKRR